ncbi:hypothetical protein [Aquimarina algiphila]|uniref:Uncharacterized protein n=1 Tax=Aquimarina algiphila TaxID=2047982 RepID=A0A554VAT9_9FLAO|nr:hypothetical protein [Aquimarina algiphila]TSE03394.1 hypothetical protein FOF46_29445 [Aquimarina algiphila]
MEIKLIPKTTVKGYSQLFGVSHHRIKAISRKADTSKCTGLSYDIIKRDGVYFNEYRLVKEEQGFIFREVLWDNGINGHHKTMKLAIVRALWHVTIHIDEPFKYRELERFKTLERYHNSREHCKHKNAYYVKRYDADYCPDCDITDPFNKK